MRRPHAQVPWRRGTSPDAGFPFPKRLKRSLSHSHGPLPHVTIPTWHLEGALIVREGLKSLSIRCHQCPGQPKTEYGIVNRRSACVGPPQSIYWELTCSTMFVYVWKLCILCDQICHLIAYRQSDNVQKQATDTEWLAWPHLPTKISDKKIWKCLVDQNCPQWP